MFVADPALMLLLILLIGIAVGLLMYRYAGSRWLTQFTSTRRGYLTSALVGVAGSFTGYHLANDCWRGRSGNCADRGRNGRSFVGVGLADDQILIGSALVQNASKAYDGPEVRVNRVY